MYENQHIENLIIANLISWFLFQDEIRVTRGIRTERENTRPKTTDMDVPKFYKEHLPFDDFQALKDWDASLHTKAVIKDNFTKDELCQVEARKLKFDRYVSINAYTRKLSFQVFRDSWDSLANRSLFSLYLFKFLWFHEFHFWFI